MHPINGWSFLLVLIYSLIGDERRRHLNLEMTRSSIVEISNTSGSGGPTNCRFQHVMSKSFGINKLEYKLGIPLTL
jgi:hypothetical protein